MISSSMNENQKQIKKSKYEITKQEKSNLHTDL